MDRPGEHWQNRLLRLYESVMSFTAASPLFTAVIKIFWDINNFKSIFSLASTWSKSSKSRKGFSLFDEWIYVCSNSRAPLLCIQKKPGLNSQAFTRTRSCCWHLFSKSPWTIPQNGGCAFTTFLCKRGLTANQCHQFLNPCVTGGGNDLSWNGMGWNLGRMEIWTSTSPIPGYVTQSHWWVKLRLHSLPYMKMLKQNLKG